MPNNERLEYVRKLGMTISRFAESVGVKFVTMRSIIYYPDVMPRMKLARKLLKLHPNFPIVTKEATNGK